MSGGQSQKDAIMSCGQFVPSPLVACWGSSTERPAAAVCSKCSSGEKSGDEGVELDSLELF